jgi:hypothetical protein
VAVDAVVDGVALSVVAVVVVDAVGEGIALSVVVAVTVEVGVEVADADGEGNAVAVQVAGSVEVVNGVDVLASEDAGVSLGGSGVAVQLMVGVSLGTRGVEVPLGIGVGVTAADAGAAVLPAVGAGVALALGEGVSAGARVVNPTSALETVLITKPATNSPLTGKKRRCCWVMLSPWDPRCIGTRLL